MPHTPDAPFVGVLAPEERVMLRTIPPGRDLDQHVFPALADAVAWLSQGPPEWQDWTAQAYRVVVCTTRQSWHQCERCGHRTTIIVRQRPAMRVAAFLEACGHGSRE